MDPNYAINSDDDLTTASPITSDEAVVSPHATQRRMRQIGRLNREKAHSDEEIMAELDALIITDSLSSTQSSDNIWTDVETSDLETALSRWSTTTAVEANQHIAPHALMPANAAPVPIVRPANIPLSSSHILYVFAPALFTQDEDARFSDCKLCPPPKECFGKQRRHTMAQIAIYVKRDNGTVSLTTYLSSEPVIVTQNMLDELANHDTDRLTDHQTLGDAFAHFIVASTCIFCIISEDFAPLGVSLMNCMGKTKPVKKWTL